MPLYEYECAQDGRFEVMQKYSDPPLQSCPTCGGSVDKLLSAPAIQFKGSGWYVTDYARKSGGDAKPSGDKAGEKASPSSSGDAKNAKTDSASSSSKSSTDSK